MPRSAVAALLAFTLAGATRSTSHADSHLIVVEPPGPAVPEEGTLVRTRRPVVKLEVGALVQVVTGSEPSGASGFRLRRTRVLADAQLERVLRLQLHLELDVNPRSELVDAPLVEAWMAFDAASHALANIGRLSVGQQRVPFGGELQLPAEQLVFIERATTSRCLGPGSQLEDSPTAPVGPPRIGEATGRDLGLRYDLDRGVGPVALSVAGGLFGGAGPNRVAGVAPLYVARVGLGRGEWTDRSSLSISVGASYAYGAGLAVRDRCSFAFVPASTTADVHRVGGDVRLRWRRLTVAGEAIAATLESGRFDAWSAGGWIAVELLPEFFEIAVRAEDYADDRTAPLGTTSAPTGEHFVALTAGAALRYWGDRFRLQYNYTRRFGLAGTRDGDGHLFSFLMAL